MIPTSYCKYQKIIKVHISSALTDTTLKIGLKKKKIEFPLIHPSHDQITGLCSSWAEFSNLSITCYSPNNFSLLEREKIKQKFKLEKRVESSKRVEQILMICFNVFLYDSYQILWYVLPSLRQNREIFVFHVGFYLKGIFFNKFIYKVLI